MKAKKLVENIDKYSVILTEKYTDLQAEFDTYRGRQLTEPEANKLCKIVQDIYDTYEEIHQISFWVAHRYQWADNLGNNFKAFTDDLEKSIKHEEN